MALNPRKPPFYGRGIAFPPEIDPNTGGFAITEGQSDDATVGIEYIGDRYSLRDPLPNTRNHVAGAIAHILLTRPGEHDTLPEFGSRLFALIFDPNNEITAVEFETWVEVATKRWEKRASIPIPGGVAWAPTGEGIDSGELPVKLQLDFIKTQVPTNLVTPFVDARTARAQEYPVGDVDANGHDGTSRYHGATAYERNGVRFIRPRRTAPIAHRSDDIFYEVTHGDTWLLISWKVFGDIRYWWAIADMAIQDAAAAGESRDVGMDTTGDPEPGTLLRLPSRSRLLMEMAA